MSGEHLTPRGVVMEQPELKIRQPDAVGGFAALVDVVGFEGAEATIGVGSSMRHALVDALVQIQRLQALIVIALLDETLRQAIEPHGTSNAGGVAQAQLDRLR